VKVLIGTSGYSYKEWKGSFYPEDLPASRMLAYYAERLGTVEANSTFYRLPTPKALADWSHATPAGFVFAIKAPQRITHQLRLVGCEEPLARLAAATETLGPKRGPVLFQLPPNFKKDAARLTAFLGGVPRDLRAAFEFRHESWFTDEVYDALRARGAALVLSESETLAAPVVATADWGYLRLRREDYVSADLARWAETIRQQPWSEAFVYFKHEDGARGPKLAGELAALLR